MLDVPCLHASMHVSAAEQTLWSPMLRWRERSFIGRPHPAARYGHKAVAVGPHLMVIYGGTDGKQLFGDVWAYDIGDKGWFELSKGGLAPRLGKGSGLHPPEKPRTYGAQWPWVIPTGPV